MDGESLYPHCPAAIIFLRTSSPPSSIAWRQEFLLWTLSPPIPITRRQYCHCGHQVPHFPIARQQYCCCGYRVPLFPLPGGNNLCCGPLQIEHVGKLVHGSLRREALRINLGYLSTLRAGQAPQKLPFPIKPVVAAVPQETHLVQPSVGQAPRSAPVPAQDQLSTKRLWS